MFGFDASSYQGVGASFKAYVAQTDFVIVKATQGTSYVNPYWQLQATYALSQGKAVGFYHYASGGSVSSEARFFVKTLGSYAKRYPLFIDWESGGNRSWGSTSWAKSFALATKSLAGRYSTPYVQASARAQVASLHGLTGLWLAGYPTQNANWTLPKFIYGTSPWSSYTIWQFSSNGVDRNHTTLTKAQFLTLGTTEHTTTTPSTTTTESDDDMPNQMLYCCRKGTDGKGAIMGPMKFFDGSRIHPLSHPDEMKALQMAFKNNTGKSLPSYTFTTEPWMARFEDAVRRVS